MLEQEHDIEWTITNNGWFMDYFLTQDKTYMPAIPDEFPIDPNNWKACIRGTGDQLQSFTSARDVAKALLALLGAPQWVGDPLDRSVGRCGFFSDFSLGAHNLHHRPMGDVQ